MSVELTPKIVDASRKDLENMMRPLENLPRETREFMKSHKLVFNYESEEEERREKERKRKLESKIEEAVDEFKSEFPNYDLEGDDYLAFRRAFFIYNHEELVKEDLVEDYDREFLDEFLEYEKQKIEELID